MVAGWGSVTGFKLFPVKQELGRDLQRAESAVRFPRHGTLKRTVCGLGRTSRVSGMRKGTCRLAL